MIIQEGEEGQQRIVLRDGQDLRELTEHHIVTEGGVGHLIIDGQVRSTVLHYFVLYYLIEIYSALYNLLGLCFISLSFISILTASPVCGCYRPCRN